MQTKQPAPERLLDERMKERKKEEEKEGERTGVLL